MTPARLPWMVLLLLLFPVFAYGTVVTGSLVYEGVIRFGRVDLGVLILTLAYSCMAVLAVGYHNGKYVMPFVIVTYTTLIVLAVSEIALRITFPPPPSGLPWPPMRRVSIAGDTMPGITGDVEFTVNRLGLRGPDVNFEEVDLRILCVGGSTTESLYVTDKLSWPWLLQEKLSRALGKSVFVGNAGKSGHFTLHHAHLLSNYSLARRFEWVILLAGINDLGSLLNRNNYERRKWHIAEEALTPTYQNQAHYRRLALMHLLARLQLLGSSGETMIQDPQGEWHRFVRQQRQAALRRKTIRQLPAEMDKALATYQANLRRIVQIAQAHRQHLVMMTQPTMYRKDLPENLERLLWQYTAAGAYSSEILEKMMDAFNQVMIEVSREEGVDYIDLASVLPKDTSTFYDDLHFKISGSEKVATIVADSCYPS